MQSYDRSRQSLWSSPAFVHGEDITIVDLTADSDETGDNFAFAITDPSGGLVQISGFTTVAGRPRPTVWTWDGDEDYFAVTMERLEEEPPGWGGDINPNGEVAVTSGVVWTPAQNLVEVLPALSSKCIIQARRLNNVGTVVGLSGVWRKGRCTTHAVLWTKIN